MIHLLLSVTSPVPLASSFNVVVNTSICSAFDVDTHKEFTMELFDNESMCGYSIIGKEIMSQCNTISSNGIDT